MSRTNIFTTYLSIIAYKIQLFIISYRGKAPLLLWSIHPTTNLKFIINFKKTCKKKAKPYNTKVLREVKLDAVIPLPIDVNILMTISKEITTSICWIRSIPRSLHHLHLICYVFPPTNFLHYGSILMLIC